MEEYVNKKELEAKGYTRNDDGIFRKLNALEFLGKKGWLDYGSPKFTARDRISAGNRLANDFRLAEIEGVSANDVSKIRVDGRGAYNVSQTILDAKDRYYKAVKSIDKELWGRIRKVCIDEKFIEVEAKNKYSEIKNKTYEYTMLCLGLDELIKHYLKIK